MLVSVIHEDKNSFNEKQLFLTQVSTNGETFEKFVTRTVKDGGIINLWEGKREFIPFHQIISIKES